MNTPTSNLLFPIFLKLENKRVLVAGGGPVAAEKLNALYTNSPGVRLKIVASEMTEEVRALVLKFEHVEIALRPWKAEDLDGVDLVLGALNDRQSSEILRNEASERHILVNCADTPDLCDFYLGSVVQKGALKLAISTNGYSPTLAKRLKEVLSASLPDELDELIEHLHIIRKRLKGDFRERVAALNELTRNLTDPVVPAPATGENTGERTIYSVESM